MEDKALTRKGANRKTPLAKSPPGIRWESISKQRVIASSREQPGNIASETSRETHQVGLGSILVPVGPSTAPDPWVHPWLVHSHPL